MNEIKGLFKEFGINIIKRITQLHEEFDYSRIVFLLEDISEFTKIIEIFNDDKYNIEEFNEKLDILMEEFENKNKCAISNNLEYELKPLIEYWVENI